MRITFCGASGVGKSTIAELLSKKYNLPFLDNIGYEEWIDPNLTPEEKQCNFEEKYFYLHQNYNEFVSSQSLYDVLTYRCINVPNFNRFLCLFNHFSSIHYDYIFFIPKEFDLTIEEESKRIRYTDKVFLQNYEICLQSILDTLPNIYYTLNGTIEERYQKSLSIIEGNYG